MLISIHHLCHGCVNITGDTSHNHSDKSQKNNEISKPTFFVKYFPKNACSHMTKFSRERQKITSQFFRMLRHGNELAFKREKMEIDPANLIFVLSNLPNLLHIRRYVHDSPYQMSPHEKSSILKMINFNVG